MDEILCIILILLLLCCIYLMVNRVICGCNDGFSENSFIKKVFNSYFDLKI